VFKFENVWDFKSFNIKMVKIRKCSNIYETKFENVQIQKYSDSIIVQLRKNVQNLEMYKNENVQNFKKS
jgi:protein associated with RNAse G/E